MTDKMLVISDQEFEGNIAYCDNHRPWSEYVEWEIMDDLHGVSSGEGEFRAVVTAEGVFCSQRCADEAFDRFIEEISWDLEGE
jgi:galactose-1-phosphate uridylyltransferase